MPSQEGMNYDQNAYEINLVHQGKILELKWLSTPNEEELKKAFKIFIEKAISINIEYLLSDNSKGITLDIAMQRWIAAFSNEVIPKSKIKKYARVISADILQEIITYKIQDKLSPLVSNLFELRVFTNKESAKVWLLDVD